jgi:O-acetyl-ADP-ribose deacetylase (regulator of RNase III)
MGARLLRAWRMPWVDLELHLTADIVAFAPRGGCDALLYGANEQLSGPLFAPSEANARLAGNTVWARGLIYPEQTVDGQVSDLGGHQLRAMLRKLPTRGQATRCAAGSAVRTAAAGALVQNYRELVHACPPSYVPQDSPDDRSALEAGTEPGSEPHALLSDCYACAFDITWRRGDQPEIVSLASALLGAGSRGFPVDEAIQALAEAVHCWRPTADDATPSHAPPEARRVLCLGVQDEDVVDLVFERFGPAS